MTTETGQIGSSKSWGTIFVNGNNSQIVVLFFLFIEILVFLFRYYDITNNANSYLGSSGLWLHVVEGVQIMFFFKEKATYTQ
ncbi:hypothetical protein D8674_008669 [Pyrus ussuriensis x Pyrus communis]|uniref:Uncharacterized protein n=1 Tax=Pyrus ussuriensis x Pyrus communis TaxID=2448454 RepID=A0A5N5I0D0_9ROSA|nr:hypothetical protein D8674_008669 [Pyrus ussuriensis x Pyrus communis]